MKTLYQSALALTIIAVLAMSFGSGCGPDVEPEDLDAPDLGDSPTPLAQRAYAPQLDDALTARRDTLIAIDAYLAEEYFAHELGPISTTFDNGARQHWWGASGGGAILAHTRRTQGEAHLIYGEILTLWLQHGAEQGYGYPLDEEHDAGWGCAKDGALREQAFTPGIEAPGYHRALCWYPGQVWTYEWVDDGAARQRLPPGHRGPAAN